MKNIKTFVTGLRIEPVGSSGIDTEGDVQVYNNHLIIYLGSAARELVTTDQVQTLTNKTFTAPTLNNATLGGTTTFSALSTGVMHLDSGGVSTSSLVVNADVSASAAISFSKLATLTSGNILVGNGSNVATSVAMSGDVTITNAGVTAIGSNKVTNAQLAQMVAHTFKGNNTGSTANALDLTATQLTAELNQFSSTLKGLVPASGGGTTNFLRADGTWTSLPGITSLNGLTTNTQTFATGTTGSDFNIVSATSTHTFNFPSSSASNRGLLTSTDWSTFNNKQPAGSYITALTGDVTAAGPGSSASTIAANAVTNAKLAQMSAHTFKGNNTGSTANASDLTATQLTAEINTFTTTLKGLVPSPGSTSGNFLKDDGTWAGAITQLTGDGTAGPGTGSLALTLATVNSNVGSFGSSTAIPSFTVNAKGLVTAASTNVVIAPAGTLTGTTLASNVVTSSLTTVGTIGTGVWSGTKISETHGGTNQATYTTGDLLYASASNTLSKLGIGTSTQALTVSGGIPAWADVVASVSASSPLSSTGGNTPTITIQNAAADGSTKGAATFAAADFNAASGVISLDYTNGQKASASVPGFLSSTDWSTFNNKLTSPLTTKGDLLGFSTVPARVAVGSDGLFLKADSGSATGVSWASAGGGSTIAIGSGVTGGTNKSILYVDSSVNLAQDNTHFNYDDNNQVLNLTSTTGSGPVILGTKTVTSSSSGGDAAIKGIGKGGSGATDLVIGVWGVSHPTVNGTNSVGVMASIDNIESGTTGAAVFIPVPTNAGDFDNYYGIYIEGAATGVVNTDNHSLHVESGVSHFKDLVEIMPTNGVYIGLHIDKQYTTPASPTYGAQINNTITSPAAGVNGWGQSTTMNTAGTTAMAQIYRAAQFVATGSVSGGTSRLIGIDSYANNSGGTNSYTKGIVTGVENSSSGTMTNAYSGYISAPINSGGGTITNSYGLYIEDGSAIGGTISRSLHVAGGDSYFGGSVILNPLTASTLLSLDSSKKIVTVALSGDVSTSGTTTTIGAGKVVNSMIAATTIDLTAKVTGTLPLANGGTNGTDAAANGGLVYSNATGMKISGAGSAGQHVVSAGAAAPLMLNSTPTQADNYSFTVSLSANAMTIALKDAAGNDASATSPIYISFRNATAATGTASIVAVTAALSVVIPSGATLGTTSAVESKINIGVLNNAGTIELVVSNMGASTTDGRISTVAITSGSSSASTFYSTTLRSNVAYRLLGAVVSTQTTAGTWAQAITSILIRGCGINFATASVEETSYTPALTGWSSNVGTVLGEYRRNGSFIEGTISVPLTGAPTGSLTAASLPSGITIDTTRIASYAAGTNPIGDVFIKANGTSNYLGYTTIASTTTIKPIVSKVDGTYALDATITATVPNTFANGDYVKFTYRAPVVGWYEKDWQ